MCKMDKRRLLYILLIAAFIVGVVLLIVGGVLYWHYSTLKSHSGINQRNVLTENSDSPAYKAWLKSSDIYRYFYFFNVETHGWASSRPTVKEVGPYVYRVYQHKTDVKYSSDGTVVDYRLDKRMEFVPHLSHGRENDTVTVPNIPAVAVASWSQFLPFLDRLLMSTFLLSEDLFVRVPVSDLLWGCRASLWDRLQRYHPELVPNDTWFGLMYQGEYRNTTDDFKVWTGYDDAARLRQVAEWNQHSSLPFWESKESNQLNGTDGSALEPNTTSSEQQYIFDPVWCRSMEFFSQGNESLSNLTVSRYVQSTDVYNNSRYARGFCTGGKCLPPGVMNATLCQDGKVPLMYSEPHFYNADPQYAKAVHGLQPNETLHESVVTVEPLTGSVVASSRKLQMNVHIRRLIIWPKRHLGGDPVFPVMWMKEEYEMSEDERRKLKDYIRSGGSSGSSHGSLMRAMVAMMAVGGALVLISLLIGLVACLIRRRSPTDGEDDRLIVA